MRTYIFASFLVFCAVVIGTLWLFQSVFMEDLYKSVRLRETAKCAREISVRDMDDAQSAATELGNKYGMCVSVYTIVGRRGQGIAEYHENAVCFIHNTSSDHLLDRLYLGASEDGEYIESVPRMGGKRDDGEGESIIYAKLIPGEDVSYMIVLNTEIYPLSSTVSTMRYQLVYVSVALIAVAAVISVVMSRVMARPATAMSREAEKLALGNYDVVFNGGGYREMEGLADALNHAAHELSGLDRMQKELIANVSHDLRTPLTLISGYSEVMRDIPGEMTAENMQIIIDETARLNSLVSDLLDVSRFMQGGGKLEISTFSLTETVREAMGRYARLIERDGYVIDFESDGEVLVRADKGRILQVIYNLVNNAVNYTGEDKRVVIRQTVKYGRCMIEVIDSGDGIPEDELPMIWDRYYKQASFHKRAVLGTGLGLSIVKNILVSHKARFGVRSRAGEGSTFWFELKAEK
ncbi:MAG: HAMP domain-containing histidine kinase [Clostridia bacterium]|nr:HAMP domain-containing histidine kinase [Clostridia bacterium]